MSVAWHSVLASGPAKGSRAIEGGNRPPAGVEESSIALAEWLGSQQNPLTARVAVNRVWAELMGQGLVEPVDDIRATNPASNEPLLDFLASDFRQHGYDIKHLIRTIMASHVFGLSSVPNERNVSVNSIKFVLATNC